MAEPTTTERYAKRFSDLADVYVDLTPQATRLVDLAGVRPGEHVLDVGCGPGTATLIAAERVGATGRVLGIDLAPNMLARAVEATAGLEHVEIREMDATDLDVGDGEFDVVVANSVVQFSGPASLAEWQRVVRPDGGRVACSLPWGPVTWIELCRAFVDRTREPFRSTMARRLETATRRPDAEAARARRGFAEVVTAVEPIVRRHATPEEAFAAEYRHGARVFLEELPPDALEEFRRAYVYAVRRPDGTAELLAEFHLWCFTR